MALKKDKTKILLPRREVLLKGGLGALGMAIGASALPFKGDGLFCGSVQC